LYLFFLSTFAGLTLRNAQQQSNILNSVCLADCASTAIVSFGRLTKKKSKEGKKIVRFAFWFSLFRRDSP